MWRAAPRAICQALAAAVLGLTGAMGAGLELPQRSLSTSKQFIVFSNDVALRARVAGFAEQNKAHILDALGLPDNWRTPILIVFQSLDPSRPNAPPSELRLFDTGSGMKLQLDVRIGSDPAAVELHVQIIRALLLELAYRDKPPKAGNAFARPPEWLVEGFAERLRQELLGKDTAIYSALVSADRLPAVEAFLASKPGSAGSTWNTLFRAASLALVDSLLEFPGGKQSLASFVRDIPNASGNPVEDLQKHFAALGDSDESLEKWWTLSIARFGARDELQGETAAESDRELEALLEFSIRDDRGAEKTYRMEDFREFSKDRNARDALRAKAVDLAAFGGQCNAMFRPIVGEYQEIAMRLARGKTGGIEKRLADAAEYRTLVLKRIDDIADHLNWIEATQFKTQTSEFDAYFRAADEAERTASRRNDPVSAYVEKVEREFRE